MASSRKPPRSGLLAKAHACTSGHDAETKTAPSEVAAPAHAREGGRDAEANTESAALTAGVRQFLQSSEVLGRHLCVGLSGGLDSVVLLHALSRLRGDLGFTLSAVHVHHGLSPNADHWAEFCTVLCRDWDIPLRLARVHIAQGDPRGIEAAARAARYQVFQEQACDAVMLAHHQDDQAETLLLQLLRGAGVKGLAAMPQTRSLDGGKCLLRPLLAYPRAELLRYARMTGLDFIEDESNAVPGYTRNYLRHKVLPAIEPRFPAYRQTLARAAQHFADCAQLLDELAQQDLAMSCQGDGLSVAGLESMNRPRARNLLRHYLAGQGFGAPTASWLDEALDQLLGARPDAAVRVGRGARSLVRYRGVIRLLGAEPAFVQRVWPWRGEAFLELGGVGVLEFRSALGEGISQAKLDGQIVTAQLLQGGERLRPDCRRPRRVLKKLLQEAAVPPWERRRLPLLCCGEDLVWVAEIGVDCAYQAGPGEPGWIISWRR